MWKCESISCSIVSYSLWPHGPTRLLCSWDSPSKNSGVACHSLLQGIFLTQGACLPAKSLQSHPTLCDPMDCSSPGFSVHGILQARILEWVPMPSSRGSSQPMDQALVCYVSCIGRWVLYHQCHLGSPNSGYYKLNGRIKYHIVWE